MGLRTWIDVKEHSGNGPIDNCMEKDMGKDDITDWINVVSLKKSNRGKFVSSRGEVKDTVGYALYVNKITGDPGPVATFTFGINIVNQCHWKAGDKLSLKFSPTGERGVFERVSANDKGFIIGKIQTNYCRVNFPTKIYKWPRANNIVPLDELKIKGDALFFKWPKQCLVMTKY